MPLASIKMIAEKRVKNSDSRRAVLHAERTTVPIQNYLERFFRAAAAPFFPKALRTRDGKFAMVLFFLAPAAAFFIFLRAAARCFSVAIFFLASSEIGYLVQSSFEFAPISSSRSPASLSAGGRIADSIASLLNVFSFQSTWVFS
jgi:hypothetical protein